MKRILSLLLVVAMIFSLAVPVSAENGEISSVLTVYSSSDLQWYESASFICGDNTNVVQGQVADMITKPEDWNSKLDITDLVRATLGSSDISKVTALKVTIEAVDQEGFPKGKDNWNSAAELLANAGYDYRISKVKYNDTYEGEHINSIHGNKLTLYGGIAYGTSNIYIRILAFDSIDLENAIQLKVTVEPTVTADGPVIHTADFSLQALPLELNGFDTFVDSDSLQKLDVFNSAIALPGAKAKFSYTNVGNGWGFLALGVNISDKKTEEITIALDGSDGAHVLEFTADDIIAKLNEKSVDLPDDFVPQLSFIRRQGDVPLFVTGFEVTAIKGEQVKGTASTEFAAECSDDNSWSRLVRPGNGWEPSSEGWLDTSVISFDNWHFNITKLVERAAGTSVDNVRFVEATLEIIDKESITAYNSEGKAGQATLKYGNVYNEGAPSFGDNAVYQESDLITIHRKPGTADSTKITVAGTIPDGAKVVALDAGGFGKIDASLNQKFRITVKVTAIIPDETEPDAKVFIRSIFNDKIALEYAVKLPVEITNPVMQFTVAGETSSVSGTTTTTGSEIMTFAETGAATTKTWYFTFKGVTPAQIGETITAEIIGSEVKIPDTSVLAYCKERLANSNDPTFKQLVSELVRYASSANKLNGGEGFTADNMSDVSTVTPYENRFNKTGENSDWDSANLLLNNTITMCLYWKGDVAPEVANISAGNHTVVINEAKKRVEISGFTPLDYGETITATLGDSTVTYSVGTYIARMSVNGTDFTKELCTNIQNYGRAAEAYASATNQN